MFGSLIIGWFLSFGYVPQQTECINNKFIEISTKDMATVAEIGLSAEYSPFKIYGSIENYQFFSGKQTFYPFRADYKIGLEITIMHGMTLIAEHECDHPVVSGTNGIARFNYLSQETRIVVRFDGVVR